MHSIHFFFLFWGWGLLDFFGFPMCSHQVLNGFSTMFPKFSIAPHFVPVFFAKTLSSWKESRWANIGINPNIEG